MNGGWLRATGAEIQRAPAALDLHLQSVPSLTR
jgi:hypothetical protein